MTAMFSRNDIDNERRAPGFIVRLRSAAGHAFGMRKARRELQSAGIKPGVLLDFSCGPHSLAAARLVGEKGRVHAMCLHPALIEHIEKKAAGLGLSNVETIYSDLETGLDEESVDTVLLFDALGSRKNVKDVLQELHRVVKEDGILMVRDKKLTEDRLAQLMLKDGLFHLAGKHGNISAYRKAVGEFYEI